MTLKDSAFASIPITPRTMRSLFLSASLIRFSDHPLAIQEDEYIDTWQSLMEPIAKYLFVGAVRKL
jgi:hypothetical protein